jgi:alpha-tubulin suppressor-like RCC1 family protein
MGCCQSTQPANVGNPAKDSGPIDPESLVSVFDPADSPEELCIDPPSELTPVPVAQVTNLVKLTELSADEPGGTSRTALFSWGRGDCGQLVSDAGQHSVLTPVMCRLTSRKTVIHAAGSLYHTALVMESGELYVCGSNSEGQVRPGSKKTMFSRPVHVESISEHVRSVAAGPHHTACVTHTGHVLTFGGNEYGQVRSTACVFSLLPSRFDLTLCCSCLSFLDV